MKNLGKTYSDTPPKALEITGAKVFISSDVRQAYIDSNLMYEFNLIEYDKDEYIALMAAKASRIDELEEELEAAKILLGVD